MNSGLLFVKITLLICNWFKCQFHTTQERIQEFLKGGLPDTGPYPPKKLSEFYLLQRNMTISRLVEVNQLSYYFYEEFNK